MHAVPAAQATENGRKNREEKLSGAARDEQLRRGILTLVDVVDGNEQGGLPPLVEESIFRVGLRRARAGLVKIRIAPVRCASWPTSQKTVHSRFLHRLAYALSTAPIDTIMSRGLHLNQIFDLKGKVAFVTGAWLTPPEHT